MNMQKKPPLDRIKLQQIQKEIIDAFEKYNGTIYQVSVALFIEGKNETPLIVRVLEPYDNRFF